MNEWTIDVNEENFEAAVLARSTEVPVLVDFWAPWCGPCRVLGPILEKLAAEYAGDFILAKLNVDDNPAIANAFGIQGIPAVKLFKDAKLATEFTGALPEAMLREFLSKVLPSATDKRAREAAELEQAGKLTEAKAIYEAILQSEPTHARALLGLGRILMDEGDEQGALGWLERISLVSEERKDADPLIARLKLQIGAAAQDETSLRAKVAANPDDVEARFELAQALAGAEKYEEALSEFLRVVKTDREFQDDGARKAIVQIFEVLGPDNPLTDRFRSELAKVLFN